MADEKTVEITSDNVFRSLGLWDADDLLVRAELMTIITNIIKMRGLTQKAAGKLLGMDQPRVSAMMNGQIAKFSTDRLLRALGDLGLDVELRVIPTGRPKGRVRVAA